MVSVDRDRTFRIIVTADFGDRDRVVGLVLRSGMSVSRVVGQVMSAPFAA